MCRYADSENATRESAPSVEPHCTCIQTSVLPNKRNTDRVMNERANREKYDSKRPPDSKKCGAYGASGVVMGRRQEFFGVAQRRPKNSVVHRRKCVRTIAGSASRSRSVRKSIVPKSRSMAGGAQIFAPIARYARNSRDEAPVVGVVTRDGVTAHLPHQLRSHLLVTTLKSGRGCVRSSGSTR